MAGGARRAHMTEDEIRSLVGQLIDDVDARDRVAFRGAQYDRGLAWVQFPVGKGGLGLRPEAQTVVNDELRRAPRVYDDIGLNPIGIGMAAPVILTYGSEELHDRLLRRIFTGEDIWCQLFSEPGAGSDVASLATRAVRDGDDWVVDGQKVWTTLAHVARFGLLLARSDPEVPKHAGITCLLVDMGLPGVEVRPLYQITGEAEFNEVFFTEVRVPDATRLGAPGDGWRVAITTLMNERVAIGGNVAPRGSGPIADAVRIWRERWGGDGSARAAVLRDRLVQSWIRHEVARLTNLRAAQNRRRGTPGPEGSVAKLAYAEENKLTYDLCVDLLGAEGLLYPTDYPTLRPAELTLASLDVRRTFLRARANSIEGGTSEVMRNILGERILGLPGEPRLDTEIPWKDVPRS